MSWKVYRDYVFIGIIETNYEWAIKYWRQREIHTGARFTLKEVIPCHGK